MCDYCCAKRVCTSKPDQSKETAWRQYHTPNRPWKHFGDDATPIKWLNRMNAGCILFLIFIPFSWRGHHFIGKLWEEGNIQFYWENLEEVGVIFIFLSKTSWLLPGVPFYDLRSTWRAGPLSISRLLHWCAPHMTVPNTSGNSYKSQILIQDMTQNYHNTMSIKMI